MNYKIQFNPNSFKLNEIKKWLIEEEKAYGIGAGFYNNWYVIERAFLGKRLVLLCYNSKAIGFLCYRILNDCSVEVLIFEIHNKYRRRGAGGFFSNTIIPFFKSKGLKTIKLTCSPRESEKFWRKEGFIDVKKNNYSLDLYKEIL